MSLNSSLLNFAHWENLSPSHLPLRLIVEGFTPKRAASCAPVKPLGNGLSRGIKTPVIRGICCGFSGAGSFADKAAALTLSALIFLGFPLHPVMLLIGK